MPGSIESITLGVVDLARAVEFFRSQLRLELVTAGRASVGLLAAWKRPVHETTELVELGMPGRRLGRIRLAHYELAQRASEPRKSWSGERLALCLPEPVAALSEGAPEWLGVELTHDDEAIAVVHADLTTATRFYVDVLGWGIRDASIRDARRFSPPDGGPGVLVRSAAQVPDKHTARVMPGHLGINLITCACDDMDALLDRLLAHEIEPVTRPTHVGLPDGRPGRVMLLHGPAGELFELTEPAA